MTAKEYKALYESDAFERQYAYEGTDLGAVCREDFLQVKLWSPLADAVTLHLYESGAGEETASFTMRKEEKGVWVFAAPGFGHGTYYDFTVRFGEQTVQTADPWARACGCNGSRSMAVDLERTNPPGWEQDTSPGLQEEQIIYEVHVKDFSNDPASGVPKEYRGKYKAFTLRGTTLNGDGVHATCLDYLKELGITHVQLLPVYDYGSVDEAGDGTAFNWGYDPVNYNVPEGSYATDPHHGEVRIRELKELVMALHEQGIGVIMDVVYNHTYSLDSWFSRTVPGYFYRQFPDGTYSNGSDCGNDVASERAMCRKYILESVLYWAQEYHMDGFRFDLMGLLDVELLNEIRAELDYRCGEGRILLYGEPWSAAETAVKEGCMLCTKENAKLLDKNVGMFCDNTRDCIKGHVFYEEVPGFVNGGTQLEESLLSSVSAWAGAKDLTVKAPSQIVTYVSAHDNLTLWDKLMITMRPGALFTAREEAVVRAYKLAAAIYFTCQGRIFFQAGEEFARTKDGDENSFRSPASLNQLDWKRICEYADILEYYQGLIALRKQLHGLTDKTEQAQERIFDRRIPKDGIVEFCVRNDPDDRWNTLAVCFNSTKKPYEMCLPEGDWELLADEESSRKWSCAGKASGQTVVQPVSAVIYGKK